MKARTVTVYVEIQGTAMALKDIRDTVKSVVQGAVDGNVRQVSVDAIQKGKTRKARR
jgi:hypothetical protein